MAGQPWAGQSAAMASNSSDRPSKPSSRATRSFPLAPAPRRTHQHPAGGAPPPVPGRAISSPRGERDGTAAANVPPGLIDDLMETYVEWREECLSLAQAYDRWSSVAPAERDLAFAAYRAALDREEQASAVYSDYVDRVKARDMNQPQWKGER